MENSIVEGMDSDLISFCQHVLLQVDPTTMINSMTSLRSSLVRLLAKGDLMTFLWYVITRKDTGAR